MWTVENSQNNYTSTYTIPAEGIISISAPNGVTGETYVNGSLSSTYPIQVVAGDKVYFKFSNTRSEPSSFTIDYMGNIETIIVPPTYSTDTGTQPEGNMMTPADTVNLFANPNSGMGGAMGGGLGAGLVGGLLGNVLLNNRGGFGMGNGYGYGNGVEGSGLVAPVHAAINDTAIMQTLGDIKASIPYAEGQVQLALAGAQSDINRNINTHSDTVLSQLTSQAVANANYIAGVNANVSTTSANEVNAIKDGNYALQTAISATAAATQIAVRDASILAERNAWSLNQAISADGEKTRALIQSIDKTNDSRLITSMAAEISDLKNAGKLVEATGNITISNTNTATAQQAQVQAQQQAQLQYQILAQLGVLNADLQSVKQSSVVFNSGLMRDSGNQSAANTRVA